MTTPREMLDRLDTRHDELIRKLDALNAEIEATLAQFGKSRPEETLRSEAASSQVMAADSTTRGIVAGRSTATTTTRRAA
jgi:hypothetical protein